MKTDEERGPLGAWAYNTRVALNLSPETVVKDLGKYDPATVRKAEADSEDMSRPLWRALVPYYQQKAHALGFVLSPVPIFGTEPPAVTGDTASLIAALERHAVAMTKLADQMRIVYLAQMETVRLLGLTDAQKERLALEGSQSGKPLGSPQPDQPRSRRRTTNGRAGR